MRMKMVCDDRTLREISNEFLALKKAQKIRDRTLSDYRKYIEKFLAQSENSLDVEILKTEILDFFAEIPKTSPARFNHPYQYLHSLFEWCAKQDYIPYNPFDKLELKKVRDDGHVQPAAIKDIQALLNALDKHNYTELRDYNIVLLMLDTGIRTSELMSINNEDYDPEAMSIVISGHRLNHLGVAVSALICLFLIGVIVFAVSFVFHLIIQLGVVILPGNQAVLAPFGGTDYSEVLNVCSTPLICKVNVENCSANAEEHPVLIDGIDVEIGVLEISINA